jgi:hypothetical protein
MATRILEIGKTRFVSGLFWQSLSRPRELKKEAAELAKKIKLDLMVLRRNQGGAQAGYAHSGEEAQSGMPSLAAAVAQAVAAQGAFYDGRQQSAHNWLGAFAAAGDVWVYFAVRDESFLPHGDFAGSKEEVCERLQADYGLGGWNVVIGEQALEAYGFHNFNAGTLAELLPCGRRGQLRPHKEWLLRQVNRRLPWKRIAVAGAVAAVVLCALGAYWQVLMRDQMERNRALLAELAHKAERLAQRRAAPPPWPDMPSPAAFADACRFDLQLLAAGGWMLDDFTCTSAGAAYSWSRGDSTVGYLLQAVPRAGVDLSGDKATLLLPLHLQGGGEERLLPARQLLTSMAAKFQAVGMPLRVTPAKPVGGKGKGATRAPDWKSYSWSVQAGGVPPPLVAALLSEPGVRIREMTFKSGEWTLKGVMYAN